MKINSTSGILSKRIKFGLRIVSIVFLTILFTGCATTPPESLKIIVAPNNEANKILDIRFTEVNIPQMKMWSALVVLTNAINCVPEKISRFSWGVHVTPDSMKDLTSKENPLVHLNLTNVTLRQVLDELCKQAGWTYKESAIGISFEVRRK